MFLLVLMFLFEAALFQFIFASFALISCAPPPQQHSYSAVEHVLIFTGCGVMWVSLLFRSLEFMVVSTMLKCRCFIVV